MPTKKTTTKKTAKKAVVKKPAKKAAKKVAKKTVTKKPVKKAVKKSTKKAAPKKKVAKDLVYAAESTSFWVSDGQILNSLIALRDAFDVMEKKVYMYHATGAHNDFANWVEVVLCDGDCAKDLRKAKTSRSAKTAVVKHLKYYRV